MENDKELEERVLAAGGRIGRRSGNFAFGFEESEGYKRGDEHGKIVGLYFWVRDKGKGASRWMDEGRFASASEKAAEEGKKHYEENREWATENGKRYREENRERLAERQKMRYEESPERFAERTKRWREENPERARAGDARRRARRREAADPNANQAIVDSRYAAAVHLKEVTGYGWEVDHTRPYNKGGKDHEDNLQVVPMKWNRSKGDRHCNRWFEDSERYEFAAEVEKRFEREALEAQRNSEG